MKNSIFTPNPVGLKKPIFLKGQPIYDLSGNIAEWTSDFFSPIAIVNQNHLDQQITQNRVIRGGNFRSSASELRIGLRDFYASHSGARTLGFRLVSDIPK
jgi:formylglycine-generating enzyme required for sulfatase activity